MPGLDAVAAYRLPECPDQEVTSQLLFQLVRAAVDTLAGTSFSRGWVGESAYPCHNWYVRVIAWFPSTRTVVVLDGHHGWDS